MNFEKTIFQIKKKEFFQEKYYLSFSILIFLLNLAIWLFVFLRFKHTDNIILHYNLFTGVDRIGGWSQLLIYPLVALIFALVDYFLAFYFFWQQKKYLSNLFFYCSALCQLIIFIAVVLIYTF
jgi:hypothetical protein